MTLRKWAIHPNVQEILCDKFKPLYFRTETLLAKVVKLLKCSKKPNKSSTP